MAAIRALFFSSQTTKVVHDSRRTTRNARERSYWKIQTLLSLDPLIYGTTDLELSNGESQVKFSAAQNKILHWRVCARGATMHVSGRPQREHNSTMAMNWKNIIFQEGTILAFFVETTARKLSKPKFDSGQEKRSGRMYKDIWKYGKNWCICGGKGGF